MSQADKTPTDPIRLPTKTGSTARDVYDADGNRTGVIIDDRYHPVPQNRPPADTSSRAPAVSSESTIYTQAAQALLQTHLDQAREQRTQHQLAKADIALDYEGQPLGRMRAGITKLQVDLDYNRQRREGRKAEQETWQRFNQMRSEHLLSIVDTHTQIERQAMRAGLDAQEWETYQRQTLFEDARLHRERSDDRQHELELKKLELAAEQAKLTHEASEADKDRDQQLVKQTFEMGAKLPDILYELRALDKDTPDAKIKAAAQVVEQAITLFGGMQGIEDKRDRENLAPTLNKVLAEAIGESMKIIKRG